jgi:hypothetical protein
MKDEHARGPLARLRSFARDRVPNERCDFCSAPLGPEDASPRRPAPPHEHILDVAKREVQCVCRDCALVMSSRAGSTARRVPRRAVHLDDFQLADDEWARLEVPTGIAFFVARSPEGKVVAGCPSPEGPIEIEPPLDAWSALVARNPVLAGLQRDVEALVVHRMGGVREHWLVSIDLAFRLAGVVRTRWRGFLGGPAVTTEIERFFARLKEASHG